MADYLDPIRRLAHWLTGYACALAAVVYGLITVFLVADMVKNGVFDRNGNPIWAVAVLCGVLTLAAGFMAVRGWSYGNRNGDSDAPLLSETPDVTGGLGLGSETITPTNSPGPHFHLVLLNDNTHSYQYVIELLTSVCGMSVLAAYTLARTIDQTGRAVVFIGNAVEVEDRMNRVLAAGPDPLIPDSTGPLQVVIEEVVPA